MAYKTSPSLISLLVSVMLLAIVIETVAVRHIHHKKTKDVDKKQPEFFFGGGFPGIGKLKHKFGLLPPSSSVSGSFPTPFPGGSGGVSGSFPTPFPGGSGGDSGSFPTPFPGGSGGDSGSFPTPFPGGSGGAGDTGHSYVPGGDDTFIPNPGFEVPYPGGGIPATPHP